MALPGAFAGGDQFAAAVVQSDRDDVDVLAHDGGRARKAGVLVEGVLESRQRFVFAVVWGAMAVAVKKLDVHIGDVVEIAGRRYDVVSDKVGGVTIEPAITKTVAEIHARQGGQALSNQEFQVLFGDLPADGEG